MQSPAPPLVTKNLAVDVSETKRATGDLLVEFKSFLEFLRFLDSTLLDLVVISQKRKELPGICQWSLRAFLIDKDICVYLVA